MSESKIHFAVQNVSGVHWGICTLGVGTTEKEALLDAFGHDNGLAHARKSLRKIGAWITELPEDFYLNYMY
jgi:hypothetical protein